MENCSMNNIDELLKEVKEKIDNEECVKEYFRLKNIIDGDKEISSLDKEIRLHQRLMCEHQSDDEIYFKEKALYEENLKKLDSHPVYANFLEVKKEVNALLIDIKNILE